ncbi:pirin family protein [Georgenia sp. MJ173]|uniref:pirin family protein n=1 Tax=Georgenia sunbinii TaxID=3117728 RepID=UPI002F2647BD
MTNLEPRPVAQECVAGGAAPDGPLEHIEPRDVPLGGPRAMTVRRTLPTRERSLIGPFCFLDHYGPDDVAATGGMDVAPHPHTGLQTVTWLFEGEVLHQDALGAVQPIRPGQLNLMTAGHGISHSEESITSPVLHGVQLWTALPDTGRHGDAAFEHVAEVPVVERDGMRLQVFMGSLDGVSSPARAYSPLVAAQVDLEPGAEVTVPLDPAFEHGILLDAGTLTVDGEDLRTAWLSYLSPGRTGTTLRAGTDGPVRAVLFGGAPFEEHILMWWNFVGRGHEEVVTARAQWQAVVAHLTAAPGTEPDDATRAALLRFGRVDGYAGGPLPAPELPNVTLRPRRR